MEHISSKYGIALTSTHLEASKVGHWVETFHVAKGNDGKPKLLQLQQVPRVSQQVEQPLQSTQQPVPTAITMPPQVLAQQAQQQAKIDKLTSIAAQWSS